MHWSAPTRQWHLWSVMRHPTISMYILNASRYVSLTNHLVLLYTTTIACKREKASLGTRLKIHAHMHTHLHIQTLFVLPTKAVMEDNIYQLNHQPFALPIREFITFGSSNCHPQNHQLFILRKRAMCEFELVSEAWLPSLRMAWISICVYIYVYIYIYTIVTYHKFSHF